MKKNALALNAVTLCAALSLCAESWSELITNGINDILIAEKQIAAAYGNVPADERPAVEEKIKRAGISLETIQQMADVKSPQDKPLRPLIPPQRPTGQPRSPFSFSDKELAEAREGLKKAPAREPVVVAPLPGRPTPADLEEGIRNLRKTKETAEIID